MSLDIQRKVMCAPKCALFKVSILRFKELLGSLIARKSMLQRQRKQGWSTTAVRALSLIYSNQWTILVQNNRKAHKPGRFNDQGKFLISSKQLKEREKWPSQIDEFDSDWGLTSEYLYFNFVSPQ